jgi:cytochrome c-type biogenesis protein CcmH
MGRFEGASRAYEQAAQRAPPSAALYADWADALAMTQGRRLAGKPEELVARALALEPENKKSLALAATAALERRDLDKALGYWRKLQQLEAPGSDAATQVAAIIAEVEEERGKAAPGAKSTGAPGPRATLAAAPAEASPAAAAPSTPAAPPSAAGGKTLSGVVEVAPAMKGRVAPDDTLYVFARTPSGSRAPLAVSRGTARDLPKTFMLDDSMGMSPSAKLSAATEVVIEARVSKSGNALPQSGDLIGKSAPVAPGASGVRIVIDQTVP